MPVDQDLERIVTRTLEHTDRLLERGETTWDVAGKGVETVMADLAKRHPQHADWIAARLADWLKKHAH
jgi:hypothetical protein